MNPLWPPLRRVLADLSALGVRCAVVGGLGAGARTEPRFTRDVDLAVAVDGDEHAESVVRALQEREYRVTLVLEQEATGRLSTVRLLPPDGDGVVIDLLFASCGIEPEIVAEAESIALAADLAAPVARAGHLIAMKLLSESPARPQDRIDLVRLVTESDAAERLRARKAIELIARRGYARGRDLVALLDDLLRGT